MPTHRSSQGRALFYHRDSGGKHDQTLPEYVDWARKRAHDLGLTFDGTGSHILEMVKHKQVVSGDLYLDYGISGKQFSRPGLSELQKAITSDRTISHILIARRDRLFRPDDPFDAVKFEEQLRELGVTIVYTNKTLVPLEKGRRRALDERLIGMVEFDETGRFRTELARKMIFSHARLAKNGHSAGGRAPYGFRRWLMDSDDQPVRELGDGEVVRLAGHHVAWLPGPEQEVATILRIVELIPRMPATQIAKLLTSEGVPTPDAGRLRTDQGVVHSSTGVWHSTTVTNIVRNSLLGGMTSYGRRSMGDQLRHSENGPRELEAADWRIDKQPKVIQNPKEMIITAKASFTPLVEPTAHQALVNLLDQRGTSQRGKPRSKDPARNPLGCRIVDLNCSFPMYRAPYNGSFRYVCAMYTQSHGARCSHNHIDGLTATRFALAAIRQRICLPSSIEKLEKLIRKRASQELQSTSNQTELKSRRAELDRIRCDIDRAGENLARANDDFQFNQISKFIEKLRTSESVCLTEIATLDRQSMSASNLETELAAALSLVRDLEKLAAADQNLGGLSQLFQQLNLQLFLRFQPVKKKKRVENKLAGGILTLGNAPAPIEPYSGPMGRATMKSAKSDSEANGAPDDSELTCSDQRHQSLGNVNRDDRI